MTVQHRPTIDSEQFEIIDYFRPAGSTTLIWGVDTRTSRLIRLLRWGDKIYLPVGLREKFGIGIYNASNRWRAYPTYVEALNVYQGGPSQPEECTPDHMWEVQPCTAFIIDGMVDPGSPTKRPFIVTDEGLGLNIGEATFGTTEFSGQIRLYEKLQKGGGSNLPRRQNAGTGFQWDANLGGATKGIGEGPASFGGFFIKPAKAAIGLGVEEYCEHYHTGVKYQKDATQLVFLQVEYRLNLERELGSFDWFSTPEPFWYRKAAMQPVLNHIPEIG